MQLCEKNRDKYHKVHNKLVKGREWGSVEDITDIIKDSNYLLPIVKVVDINYEGSILECTSQEYIIIYNSYVSKVDSQIKPCKLSVNNTYLCCGSIYNEHGVLTDVLYII